MSALRSRRAFVSATALAALAGCLGGREVPYAASGSDDSPSFPPGVSDDGLDDAEALLSAHRDRLLSEGFAAELRVEGGSGSEIDYAVESGADGAPLALSGTVENGDDAGAVDVWTTSSQRVIRRDFGDLQYRGSDPGDDVLDDFVVPYELRDAVETGAFAVETGAFAVEETDDRDGATTVTLVADAFDADELDAATLVVDGRGVIREATLELADGTGASSSMTYEVTEVGTGDPTEPAWLSEVPESAFDHFEVTVDPTSGDALAVENRGDDPVPAGTAVTVHDGDATYRADLAEPIDSGAEVYLSIRDGSLAVSDERPSTVNEPFTPSITVSIVSPDGVTISQSTMSWGSSSASESSSTTSSSSVSSSSSVTVTTGDDSDDE